MKRISICLMLIWICLILIMQTRVEAGVQSTAKKFVENVENYAEKVVENVAEKFGYAGENKLDGTTEPLKDNLGPAKERVQFRTEQAKRDLENANNNAQSFIGEFNDNVKDKVGTAKENVEFAAENTKDIMGNVAGDVKEKFSDMKENVKDKVGNAKERAKSTVENLKEKVGDAKDKFNYGYSKDKVDFSTENLRKEDSAAEKLGNFAGNVRDKVTSAKEGIENTAGNVAENMKDNLGYAKEKVENYAENMKDTVFDTYENVKDKMAYAKDKIVEKTEDLAEKVIPQELIDLTDPISDTINAGVQKVRRNLNKLQEVKEAIFRKLNFKKYRGDLDLKDESLAETDMIVDWARNQGFEEIVPMLKEKKYNLEKLGEINTSNIKDELGVIDHSYATRIVDSIDLLFDDAEKEGNFMSFL